VLARALRATRARSRSTARAAATRAAPTAIRAICQPCMPPPVVIYTGAVVAPPCSSGGGTRMAKAAGATVSISRAPARVAAAGKMRWKCFMMFSLIDIVEQ
jgi:hypothetical protein